MKELELEGISAGVTKDGRVILTHFVDEKEYELDPKTIGVEVSLRHLKKSSTDEWIVIVAIKGNEIFFYEPIECDWWPLNEEEYEIVDAAEGLAI